MPITHVKNSQEGDSQFVTEDAMGLSAKGLFYYKVIVLLFKEAGVGASRPVVAVRGARHLSIGVRLADPLQLDKAVKLSEKIAYTTKTPAVIAQRLASSPGLLTFQFQLSEGLWESYTRADVSGLGVGLTDGRQQVDYAFDPPNTLVGGTTGSGKTEAVKTMVVALCNEYKPDELSMVVVDLKGDYKKFNNLAHLSLPIARTPDEIDQAITWASQEMTRRIEAGQEREYPRLVVVIDEAENVLTKDKTGKRRLAEIQAIAKMGRAFNVNVILSTQEPQKGLVKEITGQLLNRWVGWVENGQTSYMLTGHAGLECHKLTSRGDFMHVAGPVQERLQVAMVIPQDYDRLPRAEIQAPEVREEDTPALLNVPEIDEPDQGGRPSKQADPIMVARFRFIGIDKVSLTKARDWFGMTRTEWERNRAFAIAEQAEWDRLKQLVNRGGNRNGRA
jgi:hypothetical protein